MKGKTHKLILEKWRWHEVAVGRKTYITLPTDGGHAVGDLLEIHHHLSSDSKADLARTPLLRRIVSTETVSGGRVIMSIVPMTVPDKSPCHQMVDHLCDTLESIRYTIAVESMPSGSATRAAVIGEIDQALTDAGEITGRLPRADAERM